MRKSRVRYTSWSCAHTMKSTLTGTLTDCGARTKAPRLHQMAYAPSWSAPEPRSVTPWTSWRYSSNGNAKNTTTPPTDVRGVVHQGVPSTENRKAGSTHDCR